MSSCSDCASEEEFESFLKSEGYSILNTDGLNFSLINENSEYLEQSAEITIEYGEDVLNINNDIELFINEFSQYTTQVKASIDYYGFGNCDILSKMIELNDFDRSKPYMELKVVGYECNGSKVATKLFTNLRQSTDYGSKTLYVINMDQSINTERLIDSTISFMKKAKLEKINVNSLLASEKCKFGKTDGLVIVGSYKSKIFEYARNTKEIDEFVYEQDYKEFMEWVKNTHESAIEHSEHFLGMLSSNQINVNFWYTQWNNSENKLSSQDTYRKYRLLGFIILHVTSHMANYEHWHNPYPPGSNVLVGRGYGSDAVDIISHLDDPDIGKTFERLINWTWINHKTMIDATYARFGF